MSARGSTGGSRPASPSGARGSAGPRRPAGAGRRILAALLAAAATFATVWLSRAPVTFAGEDEARLRLSWRMDGVTAEACRERTPEELERLPVHMRNPRACIGQIAPYSVDVRVDGTRVLADTARPGGARGDRPIFVYADLPVAPGERRVEVEVRALVPDALEIDPDALVSLEWSGEVALGGREVALLTLDGSGRRLELRRP